MKIDNTKTRIARFVSKALGLFMMLISGQCLSASSDSFELKVRFLSFHDPGWMKIQLVDRSMERNDGGVKPACVSPGELPEMPAQERPAPWLLCEPGDSAWWLDWDLWEEARAAGRVVEAEFLYRTISFEDVSEWDEGALVSIVFDPEKGLGVKSPSGSFYKVHFPRMEILQMMEDDCVRPVGAATVGLSHCMRLTRKRLDTELQQSAEALMETISEANKPKIRAYVAAADASVDSLLVAYEALLSDGTLQGSRHSYQATAALNELRWQQISQLWKLFD